MRAHWRAEDFPPLFFGEKCEPIGEQRIFLLCLFTFLSHKKRTFDGKCVVESKLGCSIFFIAAYRDPVQFVGAVEIKNNECLCLIWNDPEGCDAKGTENQ